MVSNSSNTPPKIRSCCARCSSGWAFRPPQSIAARTSLCTGRATSISSSTPKPDSFGQRFAREHGPSACAMAFRVKDASYAFRRCVELGAKPVATRVGPMELNIPAIEGIGGSLIYLVDRYGDRTIYDVDFVPGVGRVAQSLGGAVVHRSPDSQRRPRQHEQVGGLLREAVQLPRDSLFRHRGQEDRPVQPRHDQPVRQDPHSDQRIPGRQVADRRIPARVSRRGYSAYRARHVRHLPHRRYPARARRAVPGHAGHVLRRRGCARQPAMARTSTSCASGAF